MDLRVKLDSLKEVMDMTEREILQKDESYFSEYWNMNILIL